MGWFPARATVRVTALSDLRPPRDRDRRVARATPEYDAQPRRRDGAGVPAPPQRGDSRGGDHYAPAAGGLPRATGARERGVAVVRGVRRRLGLRVARRPRQRLRGRRTTLQGT